MINVYQVLQVIKHQSLYSGLLIDLNTDIDKYGKRKYDERLYYVIRKNCSVITINWHNCTVSNDTTVARIISQ